jgi:3-hydroxy-9,10-secoandrosta-1,3,5(10)-triene-9,17-dione monooxygenase reductase component
MQCRTLHQYEGGDHIIFVGEVVDLVNSEHTPLVFQAGKYALAARKTNSEPFLASALPGTEFNEDFLGYLLWRGYFQFAAELRKDAAIRDLSDSEFLLLVILAHNNWRSPEELAKATFPDGGAAEAERALADLGARGLLEHRAAGPEGPMVGLNQAGMQRALAALAAARSTEATFLEKMGSWDGAALKNLLRGFIVGTDPGLPHPWERSGHQTSAP